MDKALAEFVEMLRYSDVPVTIKETVDAANTVRLIGYQDRGLLKIALSQVMAKTIEEHEAFDRCFDEFFSYRINPDFAPEEEIADPEEDGNGEENGNEADVLDRLDQGSGGINPTSGGGQGGGGLSGSPSGSGSGSPLVDLLERNDRTEITMTMQSAAGAVELQNIVLMTQRGLYSRRIMEQMGLNEANKELFRREREGDETGARRLSGRLDILFEAVRDLVDRQLAFTATGKSKQFRQDILKNVRLSNVEQRDFKHMRELVRRMAKRLTDLNSRVRKVKNRGHLDIRKTMRRNVAYDGVMFETHWKQKQKDRPKVMAVCDVSGSVAQVARFLLLFLYSLNEVLPKVRSFAFSGTLGEVTDNFNKMSPEDAIPLAIEKFGGRSTDYGRAMEDFKELCLDEIDNRTTVIFLGDGRSNGADPRIDILKEVKQRAKRVIWLNPERKSAWGSGDSEMLRIAPYCTTAETCNTLGKLELIIRDLLKSS
ncbi:MAG: hypothetical protein CMN55_04175 [Sneathiella sp.]|jgi:uncharacterized protein with von Willebrand factor type A (vWA) domain|uniref:VWA domain-containing protein n=1 Tax=Sneathiella sp. TaxID=1964365 RepID=UPI000C66B009|nr:VWA domain-containing protein [Sneathiella sp.]MAL78294.1 hypothetical protein [Sneathiella sp.]